MRHGGGEGMKEQKRQIEKRRPKRNTACDIPDASVS